MSLTGGPAASPRPDGPAAGAAGSFLAFLALSAAALLMAVAGLFSALTGTLLSAQAWLGSLEDARVYERAPDAIADQVLAWVAARPGDESRRLAPLDRSDIRAVVVALVAPGWLLEEAGRVVPATVGAAAEGGSARIVISLRDLKNQLSDGPVLGVLLDRIATWPSCTAEELGRLAGGGLIRCQPGADLARQLAVIVAGRLAIVAAEIPDEVDLALTGDAPGSGALAAAGLPETLALAAAARDMLWRLGLLITVLVGLAVLAVGGPPGYRLRALAFAPTGGGLMVLALAIVGDGFMESAVASLRRALVDGGLVPAMSEIVAAAARALLDRAGWQLAWTGAAMLLVGLLLLVAGQLALRRAAGRPTAVRQAGG